jgi:hypothetical protein
MSGAGERNGNSTAHTTNKKRKLNRRLILKTYRPRAAKSK